MLNSALSSSTQTDVIVMPTSYQIEELLIKICEIKILIKTEGNTLCSLDRGTSQSETGLSHLSSTF
jgi:hypothetical protein